ncbi:very short patch repair endonuclease [Sphingomonas fuzhouensis]|uniref:very short patch repair endonuclease n=1 Tax=Sphingomonas fuzhouensis TaxID=3106033 RepID=UPI002AFEA403|nr:DNA mismatch endonuclease Vsr [Sphingomonas sp. SGZ-02]
MADVVDTATRSRMMAGIRGRDTAPELALRRALHRAGLRFRVHAKELPGRPDIVLPRWRAVVQVHGCFWHRHLGCKFATSPATRPEFWTAKFASNVERDARNHAALRALGWRTATVWECALARGEAADTAERLADWIRGDGEELEIG